MDPEEITIEARCERCTKTFSAYAWRSQPSGEVKHLSICPDCRNAETAKLLAAKEAKEKIRRRSEWTVICPSEYLECAPELLPTDESRAALAESKLWKPQNGGFGIVGRVSGQGKSKIIYATARRHFLEGVPVRAISCPDFALECVGRYDNQLLDWIQPMRDTSILILDDLGKERVNERVASAFFNLIEHRTSRGKPILFTSNFGGEELAERFGEHGPYIIRRLREYSRIIVL